MTISQEQTEAAARELVNKLAHDIFEQQDKFRQKCDEMQARHDEALAFEYDRMRAIIEPMHRQREAIVKALVDVQMCKPLTMMIRTDK